ncbi:hypothetical protein N780_13455 [Pontibacillus chungwhensis BH030062]|uniref:YolD-like protein n=1 Tax=Pontibacillus chungwhensis BH030062 TaxID=1385513 RepID=A0A0A2V080_9BACI|nr:YolD-like family protein [Pontibacillus chungwhensis]KGP92413.1 hypothetical protein N780_13455 [Pontibacillus chungwhensis BH030062]
MTDDRLRDRGTIKWTSLMLPEHVEMLKKVWKEDERVEKGLLAEDQAAEIDLKLRLAFKDDLTVEVKFHNGTNYTSDKIKVLDIDTTAGKLVGRAIRSKESINIMFVDILELYII